MPTTPKYALRYPASSDPADVPTDLGELATDTENAIFGIAGASRYRGALTPAQFAALTGVVDGDLADVIVDATLGVIWRVRYRAASGSTYKWEFVGGDPLYAEDPASVLGTNTGFADLGAVLSVTPPRAGEYVIEHGADAYLSAGAVPNSALHTVKLGAAAASDNESASAGLTALNTALSVGIAVKRTLAAASTEIRQQYRVTGGSGNWRKRWLKVTPVRIS